MSKAKKNYWFKRRRYGYGWTPASWQGWMSLLLCLLVILAAAVYFESVPYSTLSLILYLDIAITAALLLIVLCLTKGPAPRWRWGKKPGDDSKKDF